MNTRPHKLLLFVLLLLPLGQARADRYEDTITVYRDAGQSAQFFEKSYGYAVFPTIGKGGIGVGAAHGSGRVYANGKHVGNTKMTQLSIGLQLGGQAYSEIIFFEDKRAFDDFTSGNFEFGVQATAVAITVGASAQAGGTGTSAAASVGEGDVATKGSYSKGMAVFTVAKGGLMYEASLAGQKFSYSPKK
jgi:lipid-binding SYLF domain-containing protein